MAERTLHALLIAINNYPIKRHCLRGCVPDRDAFKEYLQNKFQDSETMALNIKTLTDNEATKAGIIKGFEHFDAAKDGDVCVLYFSGHGSRTPAPKEFWHTNPNKMNESVVCYDSRIEGGKDLMDKEQSYLIYKATEGKNVHFVAIYDCCHSGSNTRTIGGEEVKEYTERMAEAANIPNKLEDYYGYNEYKETVYEDGNRELSPPRGTHIHFAAAKSSETAKELRIGTDIRGIFTYYLIELLEQTGGRITYSELINALNIKVSNKIKSQSPQMGVVIGSNAEEDQLSRMLFLNGAIEAPAAYYSINKKDGKWVMDAGAIQGITKKGGTLTLEGSDTILSIGQVFPNYSEVHGMPTDASGTFRAHIKEMGFNKVRMAISEESQKEGADLIRSAFKKKDPIYIELTDSITDAQYIIRCKDNTFQLTKPNDDRPLFRRIKEYHEGNAFLFLDDAQVVAQCRNLIDLNNPRTSIKDEELKIELFRITEIGNEEDNAPKELVDWTKPAIYRYEKVGNKWQAPGFQFCITNTGNRTLYISTLYIEDNYEVINKLMAKEELAPGQSAWIIDTWDGVLYKTIMPDWKPGYHEAGVIENTEYIKVIVTTDPDLSTDNYVQKGLEVDNPKYIGEKVGRSAKTHPVMPDWATKTIKLKIVHPMDEMAVAENSAVNLMGITIKAPEAVSAMAGLSNASEAERGMLDGNQTMPPPNELWGAQEITETFEFTDGLDETPGLSVLELREVQGAKKVHAENPMIVDLGEPLLADELIMPMGFDPETGMYYPLGFSEESGEIHIETLPEESPSGTRSLGGSIKIFFQKVVLTKLGIEYKHPQLSMAVFESEESEEFTYEKEIEKVKAAVADAESIVIFMHGIIGDTVEMAKSARRIRDKENCDLTSVYDLVLTFDYENLQTEINETAKDFGKCLNLVGLSPGHGKKVDIIAHSMGGLVSRWYIEKEGGAEVISHLIQVGTPNGGSPWSDVYELASTLLARAINGAVFLKPYVLPLSFLGKYTKQLFTTLKQMDPTDSKFLKQLNDGSDPQIPYTIIAGNTKLIPLQLEQKQQGLLKKLLERFKKRGHYDALDLFLFKEPNDIAVSVKSINGIKGKEQRAFPPKELSVGCDHISYFADPLGLEVLSKVVFPENTDT